MEADYVAFGVRVFLATVFFASAVGKLLNLRGFVMTAMSYEVVPDWLAAKGGRALPFIELVAALALLVGFAIPLAVAGISLVLLALTSAVALNVMRGRILDCGCFGELWQEQIGWPVVARNIGLLAILLAVGVVNSPYLAVGRDGPESLMSLSEIVPWLLAGYSAAITLLLLVVTIGNRQTLREPKPDLEAALAAYANLSQTDEHSLAGVSH